MRIKQIQIVGYKIFKDEVIIKFPHENLPVIFVGENGAGKSSVIDAIIGSFWWFYHKIQKKKITSNKILSKSAINKFGAHDALVGLWWTNERDQDLLTGFTIHGTVDSDIIHLKNDDVNNYIENLIGDASFYENGSRLPVLVYYPVDRIVKEPSFSQKRSGASRNQFDTYKNSLSSTTSYDDFFDWFKSAEDIENEIRLNSDNTFVDIGLNGVRKAILEFLENYSKIRVRRIGDLSLILEKDGIEFEVETLSHGEKALISLVGDLARRLVIANSGSKNPLNGNGIVLIDEIDLHLHPNWQRTIIQKLVKVFPNIQFICTTHSSLVINHVTDDSVFILSEGKCMNLDEKFPEFNIYGAAIEDVMKIAQNTRNITPPDLASHFEDLTKFIEENNLDSAKSLIKKLKKITDPNHPVIVDAETNIEFKEIVES